MTFEDFVLRKVDRERQGRQVETMRSPTFERAHTRAREVLQSSQFSIQAPSFIDLYSEANVIKDMRRVKAKRDQISSSDSLEQKEYAQVAEVFEAIMLEQANAGWFGQDVSVLKTSMYDDYFNGTDMLAEWEVPENESKILGLSVDVTFSPVQLGKK